VRQFTDIIGLSSTTVT